MRKDHAERAAQKIIDEIMDRRGFRQTWDECDYTTRTEILDAIVSIIAQVCKE